MGFEVIAVVSPEKRLDLFGKEREEFFRRLRNHEVSGDGDFGLRKRKGGVSVQLNGADSEIGAPQIDCQVQALED